MTDWFDALVCMMSGCCERRCRRDAGGQRQNTRRSWTRLSPSATRRSRLQRRRAARRRTPAEGLQASTHPLARTLTLIDAVIRGNIRHPHCLLFALTETFADTLPTAATLRPHCRCGQLGTEIVELRMRLHAAEAAARASEEAAVAQQQRLAAWVDRQERIAKRHAEVYQRLRSAHAVDRGIHSASRLRWPCPRHDSPQRLAPPQRFRRPCCSSGSHTRHLGRPDQVGILADSRTAAVLVARSQLPSLHGIVTVQQRRYGIAMSAAYHDVGTLCLKDPCRTTAPSAARWRRRAGSCARPRSPPSTRTRGRRAVVAAPPPDLCSSSLLISSKSTSTAVAVCRLAGRTNCALFTYIRKL